MLGTGIKNAILLFLIILILHFLIKNTLMDKKPEAFTSTTEKEQNTKREKKVEFNIEEDEEKPPTISSISIEDKKKELFDFVMMEDESPLKEGFVEPNDKFHNELPVACDAKRIMNQEDPIIKKSKKAKDKTLHGDYLVIHEYEDESSLNGGSLLGGLSGFDSYDTMYQEYKCGT